MKAVQIINPSEMKVVELEKPVVGAGEVLVRIKYVGFCGSDLNTFLGKNPMVKLPVIPGHEVGAVCRGTKEAGTAAKNVGVEETDPRRPHFVITGESSEIGRRGGCGRDRENTVD